MNILVHKCFPLPLGSYKRNYGVKVSNFILRFSISRLLSRKIIAIYIHETLLEIVFLLTYSTKLNILILKPVKIVEKCIFNLAFFVYW